MKGRSPFKFLSNLGPGKSCEYKLFLFRFRGFFTSVLNDGYHVIWLAMEVLEGCAELLEVICSAEGAFIVSSGETNRSKSLTVWCGQPICRGRQQYRFCLYKESGGGARAQGKDGTFVKQSAELPCSFNSWYSRFEQDLPT